MSRDGLVVVIFFALATALAMGFLAVALSFPELMPWYSEPSPRSSCLSSVRPDFVEAAPMCGRFTHRYAWADIHGLYRLTSPAWCSRA
jgi:hypothetical protein